MEEMSVTIPGPGLSGMEWSCWDVGIPVLPNLSFPQVMLLRQQQLRRLFLSETSWCPSSFLDNQEQERRVSREHLQAGIRGVLGFLRVSCPPTPAPRWVSMPMPHFRSFRWFFLKSAWHFLSTVLGSFLMTYFLEKHLFHTLKYSCFVIFLRVFLFLGVLIVLLAV